MRGFADLTGQKFGKLTVKSRVERPDNCKSSGVYYLCECDCSNKRIVVSTDLRSNRVYSCGCEKRYRDRYIDLRGQKFGSLLVLEKSAQPANIKNSTKAFWKCLCDCGNEVVTNSHSLRSGEKCSCGCLQDQTISKMFNDISGQRFGRLTAIKRIENDKQGQVQWLCKCDCGIEVIANRYSLLKGRKRSCGCLQKETVSKRFKDISGQRFGKLIAIKRVENDKQGHVQWLCNCNCGNEVIVKSNSLRRGENHSCGCLQNEKASESSLQKETVSKRFNDISGQRFGKLIAMKRIGNNKRGQVQWLCKCDCGKETIVKSNSLVRGSTKSCGCLKKEMVGKSRLIDLTGKRFGKLVVVERVKQPDNKKNVSTYWLCQCDCGNTRIVSRASLLRCTSACKECSNKNRGWFGRKIEEINSEELNKKEVFYPKPSIRKEYGYSSMHQLYLSYKAGAKNRGFEFKLNEDEFKKITSSKCFYCGCLPNRVKKNGTNYGEYNFNGIDRIDSDKGYTIDNCIPCCTTCNFMKRKMPMQEFLSCIIQIYNHLFSDKKENVI
jgi:hypothetical protein